jgi:hypothetical protein
VVVGICCQLREPSSYFAETPSLHAFIHINPAAQQAQYWQFLIRLIETLIMQSDVNLLAMKRIRSHGSRPGFSGDLAEPPNLEKDVLFVPLTILRLLGVSALPSNCNKLKRYSVLCLYILHLLGGLIYCTQLWIAFLLRVFHPIFIDNSNIIIRMISDVSLLTEFNRALVVFALFRHGQTMFPELLNGASLLLSQTIAKQDLEKLLKKWRRLTICLCLLALFIHALWELSAWVLNEEFPTVKPSNETNQPPSDNKSANQSVLGVSFQAIAYSRLYFEFVLFILSQQVVVLSIVLTLTLKSTLEELNGRIKDFINGLIDQKKNSSSREGILYDLMTLQKLHLETLHFSRRMNHLFSPIHSLMYFSDFMTSMGYVATLIPGFNNSATTYLFNYLSFFIFLAYSTLLFLPLIWVEEAVSWFLLQSRKLLTVQPGEDFSIPFQLRILYFVNAKHL